MKAGSALCMASWVVAMGCGSPSPDEPFAPCNIVEAACQQRVFAEVSALRGERKVTVPSVREITVEQYAQDVSATLTSDSNAQEVLVYEQALVLLGLASPGEFSAEHRGQFAADTTPAFYTFGSSQITVVKDSSALEDWGQATQLLAHEYVHSLQDQTGDLSARSDGTFDGYLAWLSVVEGEASLLEAFYSARMWGLSDKQADFPSHFTSWVPRVRAALMGVSPLLATPRYFPYSFGALYCYRAYQAGGEGAVKDLFRPVTSSSLPVILSDGEFSDAVPEVLADIGTPEPLDGFEFTLSDRLGPYIVGEFFSLASWNVEAATLREWVGDELFLYSGPDGAVALAWVLRFSNQEVAQRVAAAAGEVNQIPVLTGDRDVALALVSVDSMATDWQDAVRAAFFGSQ